MDIKIKRLHFNLNKHYKSLLIAFSLWVLLISLLPCYVLTSSAESFPLEVAELASNENSLRAAVNRASGSAIIAINADIQLSAPLTIVAGKDITLKSKGNAGFFKLIGAPGADTITVESGAILKLDNIHVTHTTDATGTGVTVQSGGTLTMSDGEISGNTGNWGGGVANLGRFTLSGGTITKNTANRGGGVATGGSPTSNADFTMSGGEISNNKATNSATGGGGVSIGGGSFKMIDGLISKNSAPNGGAIYSDNGEMRLSAGTITNNNASNNGGAIYIKNLELLHISDSLIFSANQALVAYNRNPADDQLYNTQIAKKVTWTTPFTQGYNNYDISYTNGNLYSDSQSSPNYTLPLGIVVAVIVGIVVVSLFYQAKKHNYPIRPPLL